MKSRGKLLGLLTVGWLLFAACGPAATATSVPTPTPTVAPAPSTTATPALASTPEPQPTPTPLPTPTLTATATPPPTPTPEPPAPTATPMPAARESEIENFALESFTVSAGTAVTWTNLDTAPHTVTSGEPEAPDAGAVFDSGPGQPDWLSQGETFTFTFSQPGEFPYWCRVHPFMTGAITVME